MDKGTVWIGMVHAKPRKGNDALEGALGTYVQVLVPTDNAQTFREKATKAFDEYGFDIIEFEDLEDFEIRCKERILDPDLIRLANEALSTGECQLDTSHTYDSESE